MKSWLFSFMASLLFSEPPSGHEKVDDAKAYQEAVLAMDQEVEDFLSSLPKISLDILTFANKESSSLDNSPPAQEEPQKKCLASPSLPSNSHAIPSNGQEQTPDKLLLFFSFSAPLESWKEHSLSLEKTGGFFVIRGLPQNSFAALSQKLQELRDAGVSAGIVLDPIAFDTYEIATVPTLVLTHGDLYDKISGNIKISEALRLFADTGSASQVAQRFLTERLLTEMKMQP